MLTIALLSISIVSSVACAVVAAISVHTKGLFMAVIHPISAELRPELCRYPFVLHTRQYLTVKRIVVDVLIK